MEVVVLHRNLGIVPFAGPYLLVLSSSRGCLGSISITGCAGVVQSVTGAAW